MTVNDTDKFLVNRSNSSYQIGAKDLMAELQDTDLMLVNRGGVSYKATGAEIKDSLIPESTVVKPAIIAPPDEAGRDGSSDPAPDAENINFVSTTFASSDGSLSHASSNWQVTLETDVSYASPVYSVTGDINTNPIPQWAPGPLDGEIEYRAKVQHVAVTGEVSEWSADITFKTAEVIDDIDDIVSAPGNLYHYRNQAALGAAFTAPEPLQNWVVSSAVCGVGVSGTLYEGGSFVSGGIMTVSSTLNTMMQGEPARDLWLSYAKTATDNATCAISKASKFYTQFDNGLNPDQGSGREFKRFHKLGGVTRLVLLESKTGELFCWNSGNVGDHVGIINKLTAVSYTFTDGATFKSCCGASGNYDAACTLWLSTDGNVYYSNGDATIYNILKSMGIMQPSDTSLVSNNALQKLTHGYWASMKDVVAMGTFGSTYGTHSGAWFRTAAEELWIISASSSSSGQTTPSGPIKVLDNALSGAMTTYQTPDGCWFAIDNDGFAHDALNSPTLTKNIAAGAIFGPQGSGYASHNLNTTSNFVIVPA